MTRSCSLRGLFGLAEDLLVSIKPSEGLSVSFILELCSMRSSMHRQGDQMQLKWSISGASSWRIRGAPPPTASVVMETRAVYGNSDAALNFMEEKYPFLQSRLRFLLLLLKCEVWCFLLILDPWNNLCFFTLVCFTHVPEHWGCVLCLLMSKWQLCWFI